MLKIGLIGPIDPDSKIYNIYYALKKMGHVVFHLGSIEKKHRFFNYVDKQLREQISEFDLKSQTKFVKQAINNEVDLVINVEQSLHPKIVQEFLNRGIKCYLWFPDGRGNLSDRQYLVWSEYSKVYVTDPHFANILLNLYGCNAEYLPEAVNFDTHSSNEPFGIQSSCLIVGNYYPSRLRLINRLKIDGVPLTLHGPKLKKWIQFSTDTYLPIDKPLFLNEKANAFRRHRVVLNLPSLLDVESTNQRLYEATAAGGLVLTLDIPILARHFELEKEIVTFKTYSELLKKIHYFLNKPIEGKKIGDRAAKRTFADHKIEQRLEVILNHYYEH